MSVRWLERWANVAQNAEIAASASEDFGITTSDDGNKRKYGSMNFLVLTNRSANAIRLLLDGNIYTELFSAATLIISADEGKHFDLIRVTNLSAAAVCAANSITVRYGRAFPISNGE